jgi:hypothetical protein
MNTDKNIELHIPSVMGYQKVAMECGASMAKKEVSVSFLLNTPSP